MGVALFLVLCDLVPPMLLLECSLHGTVREDLLPVLLDRVAAICGDAPVPFVEDEVIYRSVLETTVPEVNSKRKETRDIRVVTHPPLSAGSADGGLAPVSIEYLDDKIGRKGVFCRQIQHCSLPSRSLPNFGSSSPSLPSSGAAARSDPQPWERSSSVFSSHSLTEHVAFLSRLGFRERFSLRRCGYFVRANDQFEQVAVRIFRVRSLSAALLSTATSAAAENEAATEDSERDNLFTVELVSFIAPTVASSIVTSSSNSITSSASTATTTAVDYTARAIQSLAALLSPLVTFRNIADMESDKNLQAALFEYGKRAMPFARTLEADAPTEGFHASVKIFNNQTNPLGLW